MFTLKNKLPHTMHCQVTPLTEPIKHSTKVIVTCACGKEVKLSARNLVRRWADKTHYRCKSCDVKTYVNNQARINKFRKSFAEQITPEYRKKCVENGKKPWQNIETRKRITEAIRQDNIINPKKTEARRVALEALKAKSWFREHMAHMRTLQRESGTSILETAIGNILTSLGLDFKQHFTLGHYVYDFAVDKHLIEIQGEYWHKNTIDKDSAKATYAVTAGYQIHHVWEHEFAALGKVRELVQRWFNLVNDKQIDFNFKQIVVAEAQTLPVRAFLGAYHYLPAISKSGYHVGGYLDKELIATATFSSVVRRETAIKLGGTVATIRELSRFCIHPIRHKPNFASWFLTRAVKYFHMRHPTVKMLVAFADETAGHTGDLYRAAGWTHSGMIKPDYVYLTGDGYYAHKKTIWDRARKLKMTELAYATKNGLIKVNSKQKHKFVLRLE